MSIKSSITLGLLAMLALLVGSGSYAYYTVQRLESSTRTILQDNFYSVQLGQGMLQALDQTETAPTPAAGLAQFGALLAREAGNITEQGEQPLVDSLTRGLARYRQQPSAAGFVQLRRQTHHMVQLNMLALTRKNAAAASAATVASRYLILCTVLGLLLALTLVLSVPEAAVTGLRKLSASIDHATQGDFSASIPVESSDEFGRVALGFNRLLTQLDAFRNTNLAGVLAERNRAASIVRTLDEGLLLLDENGLVLVANPLACTLLGLAERQVIGHSAAALAEQHPLLQQLLAYAQRPAARRTGPLPFTVAHHGEEAHYQLVVHDVLSPSPTHGHLEFAGTILALHNVSDFTKRDQTKSHFLATVSHELRTPLSTINFHLKLLQDPRVGTLTPEQQEIIASVKQENQRLLNLTGNLLDVSRLESESLPLDAQPLPLADLVTQAIAPVQLQLAPKQLQLDVQLPPDLPAVRADREKSVWVLLNLLTNAVRHSPAQATIEVRAARMPNGRAVRVEVQDHGPGIAPEHQEHIFQRFTQLTQAADAPRTGSGLGLSIGREFITSQGGQLGVESTPGAGSTFFFTLPIADELA
ncbi:HAMP domain-containing protein [Hymenobacter sp. HMF4947]|uniref:histidine kinase n=1 Tax=Hymenobacter ginkgonis TaxID=2682976 RepID=A0A7K1TI94_9BACT|nr:ATP-binding protein [Hymenobacter ginkgonis]MVN78130.1 HAMP domain-containing protein [Hymenobacter ginkgonis]